MRSIRSRYAFLATLSSCALVALGVDAASQGFTPCTRVLHTLEGEAAGDNFGWVSSPLPDTNGDGVEELVIGAPFHAANAGRAYLFDGRTGAELSHADGSVAGERLGFAVRDAGDLDGDGIGDWIAGGRGSSAVAGAARVVSGATGLELLSMQLGAPGDFFGYSVAGVGDVDGDLVPDFAVGATQDDSAATNAGRVVVVSGADGVTVLRSFLGAGSGDNLGTALARLGDVTGDGRPELVVGAANAGAQQRGRAYVYDVAAGTLVRTLAPDATGAEFGQFFVADAGNVDGDLFPDVYVGDFADLNGSGKAYVYAGASGARLLTLVGQSGSGFGIGRSIGDVNGDGRDDLVLGAFTFGGGAATAGKAEVFSGADGARLRRVTSTTAGENFGFDAHGLGDADGDGVPELVVTAASYDNLRGRVYVIADAPLGALGSGTPGSGGLVPALALTGCPVLGTGIALETSDVLGGAMGVLVVGTSLIDLPIAGGVLHPSPTFLRVWHVAAGAPGTPGAGSASLPFALPNDPALVATTYFAQAIYADPGGPAGFAFTPGLRLTLY